ncbi:MAG: HAD family hydrolase [Desulfobacteraceae bacterium]|nr:MAG: HAD family hydrolase [Desulfobacteraceae bacterium]
MHLFMFDIDDTLVNSSGFEDECFTQAINRVIDKPIETDWSKYKHATDTGIIDEIIHTWGYSQRKDEIAEKIKNAFINNIKQHLSKSPANEIPGARSFLSYLSGRKDILLSIATGGWEETAKLKLDSAGIDYKNIQFASSSDHHSRVGIMRCAERKHTTSAILSKTYFGDAVWDKKASKELGYMFILIGNKLHNEKRIENFEDIDQVMKLTGL